MAYIEASELLAKLDIRSPTDAQTTAAERVLDHASLEIDREIDRDADNFLSPEETAIAEQVCLQRAIELWSMLDAPFNIAGAGIEFGSIQLARNSWDKHAYTLAPLKEQFGLA